MGNAFIIDTRTKTFTVKEVKIIGYVDMALKCRLDNDILTIKKGNYFDTKQQAEEKLDEIIYVGRYKTRKKNKRTNSWKCSYCGKVIYDKSEVTVDHIIPKSKGGTTTDDNLTICCKSCNGLKSSKSKEHYLNLLKVNSRRKMHNPGAHKRKIRYTAYNRHGKNIESIARMDGTNISMKYIGNYVNVVDRALEKHNMRNAK